MERLLAEGCLDVFFTPVFMKKNRPGQLLTVLCREGEEERFASLLFLLTTTIGVRYRPLERFVMRRAAGEVMTPYGRLKVKRCSFGDICRSYVEFESARELALNCGVTLDDVYRAGYAAISVENIEKQC